MLFMLLFICVCVGGGGGGSLTWNALSFVGTNGPGLKYHK